MADEPMVVYTAGANTRTISAKEWEAVGVDDGQKDVSWDETNFHEVAKQEFTPKAIAYIKHWPREWRISDDHQEGNAPVPDNRPHAEEIVMPPRRGEDDEVGFNPSPAKKEKNA